MTKARLLGGEPVQRIKDVQGPSTKWDLMATLQPPSMPGETLKTEKMPGHWLLARLGKRVLRPGGRHLTARMLEALRIQHSDDVVEFAPGMGLTARLTLELGPAS